jgi:hypothetical protein
MLRHVILVSLAMTACASLIPTNANAATLTVLPGGEIPKKPNDSIEFIFNFNPALSGSMIAVSYFDLLFDYDKEELRLRGTERPINGITNVTTTIARYTFDVLKPIKDRKSDLFNVRISYREISPTTTSPTFQTLSVSGGDVVPVPEPLTMLGAAAALGYGGILKRKYSKNTES